MGTDDPGRIFQLLVADALEALLPLVDQWAADVERRQFGDHARGHAQGYQAGVRQMAAEVKDQLVDRILRLRTEQA